MTKVIKLALAASVLAGGLSANDVIKGSGASFPYSVYQSWTQAYYKATGTVSKREIGKQRGKIIAKGEAVGGNHE